MTFYLLQVSVCWLVFYGLYWLILSRETFFSLNRWYLLGTLVLGLLIPLLEIPLWNAEPQDDLLIAYLGEMSVTAQSFGITLEEVVITAGEHAPAWSSASILLGIYLLGVLIFASLFLGGLWRIHQLRQRSEVEVFEGYHLLYTSEIHLPFSFFNQLFWSQSDHWTAEERSAILRHELAHIKGRHSWDVLLLELLKVFFWFSPGIYLYKRSLRNVHEYLADSAVLQNTRKKQYGRLLLRQVQQQTQPALVNPFFHSQIKKRIQMMIRNKSKRFALYKYAFLLPLTALLLLTFSSNVKGASELVDRGFIAEALTVVISDFDKEKAKAKIREALRNYDSSASDDGKKKAHRTISDAYFALLKAHPEHREEIRQLAKEEINSMELPLFIDVVDGEDRLVMFEGKLPAGLREREAKEAEVFSVVEEMPRFPACEDKGLSGKSLRDCANKQMLNFIYNNVNYPKEAREKGVEGMVVARFVVGVDGNIRDINIIRPLDKACDKEVLRVVGSMNEKVGPWVPGVQNGKKVAVYYHLPIKFRLSDDQKSEGLDLASIGGDEKPLFILDGKELKMDVLKCLNPDDIETITVLKGEKAISAYGEKAANGVVVITSKNNMGDKINEDGLLPCDDKVYDKVDVMPRFPGCESGEMTLDERKTCSSKNLISFLVEHIRYPDLAKKNQVEGTVVVRFVVDKNGRVQSPEVIRSIGSGCDAEVMRIMEKMQEMDTPWNPGKKEGEAVSVYFNLPIKFKMSSKDKKAVEAKGEQPAFRSLVLNEFKVFPNPSDGKVNVRFKAEEQLPLSIQVVDLSGKVVYLQQVQNFDGDFQQEIDLSTAPKGQLFLNIIQGDKGLTKALILK